MSSSIFYKVLFQLVNIRKNPKPILTLGNVHIKNIHKNKKRDEINNRLKY